MKGLPSTGARKLAALPAWCKGGHVHVIEKVVVAAVDGFGSSPHRRRQGRGSVLRGLGAKAGLGRRACRQRRSPAPVAQ
jgi:hypothetical protein